MPTPTTIPGSCVRRSSAVKAGVYRTQEVDAGPFLGYRTNDSQHHRRRRNLTGTTFPFPRTQIGIIYEHSLFTLGHEPDPIDRGVAYARYVLTYGSSLYLPPFEYVGDVRHGRQPQLARLRTMPPAGTDLFNDRYALGVHYHKMFLDALLGPRRRHGHRCLIPVWLPDLRRRSSLPGGVWPGIDGEIPAGMVHRIYRTVR